MNVKKKKTSGFVRYFSTPNGKGLCFIGAAATTIGLFGLNFIPNTLGLTYYRNVLQCYQKGEEKLVSSEVLEKVKKCMSRLQLNNFEKSLLKPFIVVGFDFMEAGSTKSRFGGILGIPSNYEYKSKEDIDKDYILYRNKPINWDSEAGKNLKKALVLTEDEQMFAISKSILQLQTHRVLLNSLFPSFSFMMVYTIGTSLNSQMNLLQGPFFIRGIMYTILGLFGFGLWSFLKDFNQVQYDKEIDEKLSSLGDDMVKAGHGYYEKLLLKNIALRNLMGDETYSSRGNINYFIRIKSLPLTNRKQYFEQKLNKNNLSL